MTGSQVAEYTRTMTPTESRLFKLILSRLSGKAVWTRLVLVDLVDILGVSERTIRRAKASLESHPALKWRTITNAAGRGHQVLVAAVEKLAGKAGELLRFTRMGKPRTVKTKVGGEVVSKNTPHDIPHTYREPMVPSETNPQALNKPDHSPAAQDLAVSPGQVRLAHRLKRDFMAEFFWENCKIKPSEPHLYGMILRALRAGYDQNLIRSAFEKALKVRHGDATDWGLRNSCPTQVRWSLSSTVSLVHTTLQKWRNNGRERQARKAVGANPSARMVTTIKRPAKHQTSGPNTQHLTNQSAVFRSVLESIA